MTKPEPPEGTTNFEPPAWLHRLDRWVLVDLLQNPHAPLTPSAIDSLHGRPHIRRVNPSDLVGNKKEVPDQLSDEAIEQLKSVRRHLDMWWNNLPGDTRVAFRNSLKTAGMVEGKYRDDVAALGSMGQVDSGGRELRGRFKLPVPVLAYLQVSS
jgi:hypothetical protein